MDVHKISLSPTGLIKVWPRTRLWLSPKRKVYHYSILVFQYSEHHSFPFILNNMELTA